MLNEDQLKYYTDFQQWSGNCNIRKVPGIERIEELLPIMEEIHRNTASSYLAAIDARYISRSAFTQLLSLGKRYNKLRLKMDDTAEDIQFPDCDKVLAYADSLVARERAKKSGKVVEFVPKITI